MKTVFSNAHFVAIDKPAGVLSVPSRFSDSLENKDSRPVARTWLQEHLGCRLFPVHRLDFEVSGILLFAKSAKAQTTASRWLEQKKIQKTYSALSEFAKEPAKLPSFGETQTWEAKLLRGKREHKVPTENPVSLWPKPSASNMIKFFGNCNRSPGGPISYVLN